MQTITQRPAACVARRKPSPIPQAEIVFLPRPAQKLRKGCRVDLLAALRRGQEGKIREFRMHRRVGQRVLAAQHLREGNRRKLGHAEGDVQIAKADVRIDAEHSFPLRSQAGGNRRADGGFARAALAGDDRNHFSHAFASF